MYDFCIEYRIINFEYNILIYFIGGVLINNFLLIVFVLVKISIFLN